MQPGCSALISRISFRLLAVFPPRTDSSPWYPGRSHFLQSSSLLGHKSPTLIFFCIHSWIWSNRALDGNVSCPSILGGHFHLYYRNDKLVSGGRHAASRPPVLCYDWPLDSSQFNRRLPNWQKRRQRSKTILPSSIEDSLNLHNISYLGSGLP